MARASGKALLWSCLIVFAVLIGLLLGTQRLLGQLDQPRVRAAVCRAVAAQTGLELDYQVLSLSPFSGLRLEGLSLANPKGFREAAPRLITLEQFELGWSLWSLLGGDIQVRPFRIAGLDLHLVVDGRGRSSLDALLPPAEEAQPSEKPGTQASGGEGLSHVLARALPTLAVEEVSFEGLRAELLQMDAGRVVRRVGVTGPALRADLRADGGQLDLAVELKPLAGQRGVSVVVEDHPGTDGARTRRAVLDLNLRLVTPDPGGLDLTLDLTSIEQDLIPDLPSAGPLAKLNAAVSFEPLKDKTWLRLTDVDLLQGAARMEMTAVFRDLAGGGFKTRIEKLKLNANASQVLQRLGLDLPGLTLEGASLTVGADDLVLDGSGALPRRGTFETRLELKRARLARNDRVLALDDLSVAIGGQVSADAGLAATLKLAGGQIEAVSGPEDAPTAQARVGALNLTMKLTGLDPDPTRVLASRGRVAIAGSLAQVSAKQGSRRVLLRDLGLTASTTLDGTSVFAGELELPFGSAELTAPEVGRVDLASARLTVRAMDLDPDFARPAVVHLGLDLDRGQQRQAGRRVEARGLRMTADLKAESRERAEAKVHLPLRSLNLHLADDTRLGLTGLTLDLSTDDLHLPADDPARASAQLAVETRLGSMRGRFAGLRAQGHRLGANLRLGLADGAPVGLSGQVPLGDLRLTRTGSGQRVLSLRAGRLDLSLPQLRLAPAAILSGRVALRLDGRFEQVGLDPGQEFGLESMSVRFDARGRKVQAGVNLALTRLRLAERAVDAELKMALSAQADLRRPAGRLTLEISGRNAPALAVDAELDHARRDGRLTFRASSQASKLGLLGRLLPAALNDRVGLNWSALAVDLHTDGELRGLVTGFDGLAPRLAADPAQSALGRIALQLDLKGLDLRRKDLQARIPGLKLALTGQRGSGGFGGDLQLKVERLGLGLGQHQVDLRALEQKVTLSGVGRPKTGQVQIRSETTIGKLVQDFVAGYPLADANLTVRAAIDRLASLRLEELRLVNPAANTRLTVEAAVDRLQDLVGDLPAGRLAGRQALGLSGSLEQDLGRLHLLGKDNTFSGQVTVPFRLESGDLQSFRLAARLDAQSVRVHMPAAGVTVEGFSGQIPILEDLARQADGSFRLVAGPPGNPYARARFVDVHPFLRGENFLTIDRLAVLGQELGPVAGNMRVSWSSLAVDQLQVAYRGGTVTGQLAADLGSGHPRLYFKGNATGIRPSQSKDILDANATLDLSTAPLALGGRIQIVRIGRQHLLDLLDWIDPYHESVDVNRARLGLSVGYPKFLRLRMQDGFLSAKIELGGVAGVVRIDEIRGIALGPLLQKYLAPLLERSGGHP